MIKYILSICLIFLMALLYPFVTYAQSTHEITYDFNFYINKTSDLDVELDISLKNLRADLYINEFSLTFPNNFNSDNLRAQSESGEPIPFIINKYQVNTKVTFNFPEPEGGRNSETHIKLFYSQKGVFSDKGAVAEAILPLLIPKEGTTINVALHLPVDFDRKISLSKPIPSAVEFNTIKWDGVKAKTIVALFGEAQHYKLKLTYGITNNERKKTIQYIALPPETLYQNITMESLIPPPHSVLLDEDGNYLAGYELKPEESKEIVFKGYAKVFARPQESKFVFFRTLFESQKKYLLSEQPYWKLDSLINQKPLKDLVSASDIYTYVVNSLTYYRDRFDDDPNRFGAKKALQNPEKAVCMEFTDLFIALGREKGFYSREVQGYGYSEKQSIRPQSLTGDILHSWPEYYDAQKQIWVPLDPTWEDTSGIDYFFGFDVNHIAFVIHGKYSQSPLPAGFYITSKDRNVDVSITNIVPKERKLIVIKADLPDRLEKGKKYSFPIYATNLGNTFQYDINILIKSNSIKTNTSVINIDILAPYETKVIQLDIVPQSKQDTTDTLQFMLDGGSLYSKQFVLTEGKRGPFYFNIAFGLFSIIILSFIALKFIKK
ncbi:hypothetical protein A3D06_00685 [Candidatus Roizmanbacteria bacterium RIFCSPHIGHO2_02_FULL_40_9]|uniref:Transglutaminase-like domain-containing protein n=2 Tax=Candidatus Roizmaniibacteriota TaxID=1752723 RepID=A0A1F7IKB4_9BACT|nr:MAG: hypothetical protein A3D06_00685 [Candidatus Roizmanbacteria bacterium RIFCSPHIGHO2_02_FULL_40_9]OGK43807.1 MAG: hypothetical protein A2957_02435 [Candidatus Roizmanbacteria bacterium RIFCSPLOWO2_01_FULL_38_11]